MHGKGIKHIVIYLSLESSVFAIIQHTTIAYLNIDIILDFIFVFLNWYQKNKAMYQFNIQIIDRIF